MIGYIFVNIIILLSISPIIDNLFKDLDKTEDDFRILVEVVVQIFTISIIWYLLDKYIIRKIKFGLNLHKNEIVEKVRDIVIAVILVGLQSHLINKLKYISKKHPLKINVTV